MQEYVLGFRFSPDRQWVVLIEKRKPAWQYGRLNGIGGKIEPGETAIDAMVREFEEETGLDTKPSEWAHALTMEKEGEFLVYIFASVGDITDCHTMEEEEVFHANTFELPIYVIRNLRWIIPMLLDPELALPITVPFVKE
jgi:8-oxo-dGTP diphosphatase